MSTTENACLGIRRQLFRHTLKQFNEHNKVHCSWSFPSNCFTYPRVNYILMMVIAKRKVYVASSLWHRSNEVSCGKNFKFHSHVGTLSGRGIEWLASLREGD